MAEISITELSRNLSDYINRVSYKGERFKILRGKKTVAEISPVPVGKTLGDLIKIFSTLPEFTNEEAESFAADFRDIRLEANQPMPGDPWESS